eukprot:TRINITY_DN102391_c0_g1_i1.p1 TRINITY_DN102391_c0_g1~~TRINITY_DN102391_c0_g1_i1.p1  ORF type:complete len:977 (+),score=152.66 TRINITY_DN102391_c0_g1_i1:128-3058(+)
MAFSRCAYLLSIGAAFVVDMVACIIIDVLGSESHRATDGVPDYEKVTSDTLVCCITRLVAFPSMAALAMCLYRRKEASSDLVQWKARLKQQQQREESAASEETAVRAGCPISGGAGPELGTPLVAAQEPASSEGSSAREVRITGGGSGTELGTLPAAAGQSETGDAQTVANGNQAPESVDPKRMFEMQRDHTLLMKEAEWHRDIVMMILFAISTGMSFYNGIKCIDFDYDERYIAVQGALQASILIWINMEYFMIKSWLGKCTEEEGEKVPPHIHMHPLFFETGLKCHQCDICSEAMKGPHYIAYRCRTCDFDLCPRCYKNKDKNSAKGFGARSVRKDQEQITTWTYFRRIVDLTQNFKGMLGLAFTSLVLTQGLQIWAPNIQGSIFDGVIKYLEKPESGRDAFEKAIIAYLVVNVLQGLFGGLKALAQEIVMRRIACQVRLELFASVIRMDIAFFDTMHTGQLTSRLTNDASQMVQPLNTLLNDLVANLLLLMGGMLMAFKTSWKLSVLALTIVPPITYCYRAYAKFGRDVNRSIYCAYGEANSTATEAISNIRTVRGFSTEKDEMDKYASSINTGLEHGIRAAKVGASVSAFSQYLNLGTAVLILWYGGVLVCDTHGQAMSIGKLITFQLYWNMMNSAFISLGNVFNDLIRSSSAAERVFSLIDARPEVNPDEGENVDKTNIEGRLELKGIQFRYRSNPDKVVLKSIDMKLEPRTTTALVGKSGGGKSTLVHLLMRFYEPTEGAIMLDGRDMKTLSSRSVRECCGFVAQDTQLFACSIEENLAYGLGRKPTKEEVKEACLAANAHEFIVETEEGYETRVGEKGILLSGGQKQRLAIARCFLRKPKLLFLDEATSALDAENEAIVQDALEKLIKELGCTVVLIAHRLSTVINATKICVVHKGSIVEHGTHDQLKDKKGGIYAQLISRQKDRDASTMDAKAKANGKPEHGKGKSNLTEIDQLMTELEESGGLNMEN